MTLQEIWDSIGEFFKSIWTYFFGEKKQQSSAPENFSNLPSRFEDIPLDDKAQDMIDVTLDALPEAKQDVEVIEHALPWVENASMDAQVAGMGVQGVSSIGKKVSSEGVKGAEKIAEKGAKRGLGCVIENGVMKPLFGFDAAWQGYRAMELYQQGHARQGDFEAASAIAWGAAAAYGWAFTPALLITATEVGIDRFNAAQRKGYVQKNTPLEEQRRALKCYFIESCQQQQEEKQLAIEWGLWTAEQEKAWRSEQGVNAYAHVALPENIRQQLYAKLAELGERGEAIPLTKEKRLLSFWNYQEMVRNTDIDLDKEAGNIQESAYNDPNRWWNKAFFWRSSAEAFNKANKDPRAMSPAEQEALALSKREYDVAVMLGIRENVIPPGEMKLSHEERLVLYKKVGILQGDVISHADEEKFKCLETIPRDQIHITLRVKSSLFECEEYAKSELIKKYTKSELKTIPSTYQGGMPQQVTVTHIPKEKDLKPEEVRALAEETKLQAMADPLGLEPEELIAYFKGKYADPLKNLSEAEKEAKVKSILVTSNDIILRPDGEMTLDPPFESVFSRQQKEIAEQKKIDDQFKGSRIKGAVLLNDTGTPVYVGVDTSMKNEGVLLIASDKKLEQPNDHEVMWVGGSIRFNKKNSPYSVTCNGVDYQVVEMEDVAEMRLDGSAIKNIGCQLPPAVWQFWRRGELQQDPIYYLNGRSIFSSGPHILENSSVLEGLNLKKKQKVGENPGQKPKDELINNDQQGAGALRKAQESSTMNGTPTNQKDKTTPLY